MSLDPVSREIDGYCNEDGVSVVYTTIQQIVNFFILLFLEELFCVSSINNYFSALNHVLL